MTTKTTINKTLNRRPAPCENYEKVAQFILNQQSELLGLDRVEGKQKITGLSGTEWEIDAKGVKAGGDSIVLVECRRYTGKGQTQEQLAAFVYRIRDCGASGGYMVSHKPLQKGAKIIAEFENVIPVRLDKDSTVTDYLMKVLNHFFVGVSEVRASFSDCATVQIQQKRSVSETLPLRDAVKSEVTSGVCKRGGHAHCVNTQCVCPCHVASLDT